MSNQKPFTLEIFVADGDPDGLRIVERTNWSGKAVIFPRAIYPEVREREEFKQTGVYLLLGPQADGDGETIYIGEGDPVRPRLESHYANKDFWTRAVFFVASSGKLNKAHVQYLEARMVSRAVTAKRVPLENANKPTEATLSESDRAYMEVFLENILGMLPVLGVNAFEQSAVIAGTSKNPLLTCKGGGITASGQDTPQGFVVQAGSFASKTETPGFKKHLPTFVKLRNELQKNGVLVSEGAKLKFVQNYTFTAPSTASSVVLGRSSNGRTSWKDGNGKTLKELQEAQASH